MNFESENDGVEVVYDEVVAKTPLALYLKTHMGNVWIPKSEILDRYDGEDGGYVVVIPEWLAFEKGLI